MYKAQTGPTAAALFAVVAAAGDISVARAADLSDLNGSWQAAETKEEGKARASAINAVANSAPFFARGKVKDQLKKRTEPAKRLGIKVLTGNRVRLELAGGQALELELDGAPQVVERRGQKAKVTAREAGGALIVRTEGEKGHRVATYRRGAGKYMHLSVEMAGGKLKKPLTYSQTFLLMR